MKSAPILVPSASLGQRDGFHGSSDRPSWGHTGGEPMISPFRRLHERAGKPPKRKSRLLVALAASVALSLLFPTAAFAITYYAGVMSDDEAYGTYANIGTPSQAITTHPLTIKAITGATSYVNNQEWHARAGWIMLSNWSKPKSYYEGYTASHSHILNYNFGEYQWGQSRSNYVYYAGSNYWDIYFAGSWRAATYMASIWSDGGTQVETTGLSSGTGNDLRAQFRSVLLLPEKWGTELDTYDTTNSLPRTFYPIQLVVYYLYWSFDVYNNYF